MSTPCERCGGSIPMAGRGRKRPPRHCDPCRLDILADAERQADRTRCGLRRTGRQCPVCQAPLREQRRHAVTCSTACRVYLHRLRKAAGRQGDSAAGSSVACSRARDQVRHSRTARDRRRIAEGIWRQLNSGLQPSGRPPSFGLSLTMCREVVFDPLSDEPTPLPLAVDTHGRVLGGDRMPPRVALGDRDGCNSLFAVAVVDQQRSATAARRRVAPMRDAPHVERDQIRSKLREALLAYQPRPSPAKDVTVIGHKRHGGCLGNLGQRGNDTHDSSLFRDLVDGPDQTDIEGKFTRVYRTVVRPASPLSKDTTRLDSGQFSVPCLDEGDRLVSLRPSVVDLQAMGRRQDEAGTDHSPRAQKSFGCIQ